MKVKITKTKEISESWIEKNGKIIEALPLKEAEYIEKEINQESFRISFEDGTDVEVLFPENKIAYCYGCKKKERIISLMKYTKNAIRIDGLDNLNFCSECSFKEIEKKVNRSLKNPEILKEIKEEISYKEKLHKEKAEEKFIHEKSQ